MLDSETSPRPPSPGLGTSNAPLLPASSSAGTSASGSFDALSLAKELPNHRPTSNGLNLNADNPDNALSLAIINSDASAFEATLALWSSPSLLTAQSQQQSSSDPSSSSAPSSTGSSTANDASSSTASASTPSAGSGTSTFVPAVKRVDELGCTGLHWAALYGRTEMVERLLKLGADANAAGGAEVGRQTPLHFAINQGRILIAEQLIQHGGDIDVRDDEGFDSLFTCVVRGRALTAHYLIAQGANKHSVDPEGRTVLHWAVIKGMHATTVYLLNQGLRVDAVDQRGMTPLHYAAISPPDKGVPVLKELLRWGADEHALDRFGRSPAYLAQLIRGPAEVIFRGMAVLGRSAQFPPKQLPQWFRVALFLMPTTVYALALLLLVHFAWWIAALGIGLLWSIVGRLEPYWCPRAGSNPPTGAGYTFMNIAHIFVCFTFVLFPAYYQRYPAVITLFYCIVAVMLYCFYHCTTADPGYFRLPTLTHSSIVESLRAGHLLPELFCTTCCHNRPLRSKHCSVCDRCVARFDHHCGFISNCVGQHNHRSFVVWLATITLCNVVYLAFCLRYLLVDVNPGLPLLQSAAWLLSNQLYMVAMTAFGIVHIVWLCMLTGVQFYLVYRNATTNEQVNWGRYSYQRGKALCATGSSHDFELGAVNNFLQFFRCPGHAVDWSTYQKPLPAHDTLDV